ncbi:SET domain-containing protein 4-like [Tropilaelaps mercedesae]|uniref:SET domain-containing protein 4-like n=1 Tax=Tropilaelaps mercedesae TaxID=418985 RepID=A0A1V9Y0Z8_9ACAR|nr:SET domain-containing protein 4-like [Tropilaelaps mercedesae]
MGRTFRKRKLHRRLFVRDPTVRDLYSWIVSKGFRPSKCQLRLAITASGRGMVCQKPISAGDTVIDLPQSLLITKSKIRSLIPHIPGTFSAEEVLAVFLIVELRRGFESPWLPYINSLPKKFTSPFNCSSTDVLPRGIQHAFDRWRNTALQTWQRLSNYFLSCRKEPAISESEFTWSWCAVTTRCVFVEGHGSSLAPFLDMLNHHWTASVNTQFKDGHFVISTNRAYRSGEEVFINYGSHDNRTLLLNYGFVLDDNPNNCVPVERYHIDTLHTLERFSQFSEKMQLIEYSKLLTDQTGFTSNGATWNLVVVLDILQDCRSYSIAEWKAHIVKERGEKTVSRVEALLAKVMLNDYCSGDLPDVMLNKLVRIEKKILCNNLRG